MRDTGTLTTILDEMVDLLNDNFHNLKDIVILNSMINVINTPTRQNALFDPIIIPNDMEFSDIGIIIMLAEVSDHSATHVSIPFTYEIQPCYERNIWLYSKANYEMLDNKILNCNWNMLNNGSVDKSCEVFTKSFTVFAKQCLPWKTMYSSRRPTLV